MSYEIGIAIKHHAYELWRRDYPEAAEFVKTASTQYCTDAGCVYIWTGFPDWGTELVLHEALDALDERDFHLLVLGESEHDSYTRGAFSYFNLRVKRSLTFDGDNWWV